MIRYCSINACQHSSQSDPEPADRIFEPHISVKHKSEPHKPAGVVRGVDVRGRHLAAVVDAAGNQAVYNARHKLILREMDMI